MGVKYWCDGKVKYRSYSEASNKVKAMKRSDHLDKAHQTLNFYRCKHCHYYHIGNSNGLDKFNRNRYKRNKYGKRSNTPVEDY